MNKRVTAMYVEEDGATQAHATMTMALDEISSHNSARFWTIANSEKIPLEFLVKALRSDCISSDKRAHERLFEIINRRLKKENEYWAYGKLAQLHLRYEERQNLIRDLCADLDFAIYRALIDKKRSYWEQSFSMSLYFERKRTFSLFMHYECFWKPGRVKFGKRIPRVQLLSIEQMMHDVYEMDVALDIEDGQVQKMLSRVELYDVRRSVLAMPYRLRVVVWLLHWHEKPCREIAHLLHVSERTVRNRLQKAYALLRAALGADFCYM